MNAAKSSYFVAFFLHIPHIVAGSVWFSCNNVYTGYLHQTRIQIKIDENLTAKTLSKMRNFVFTNLALSTIIALASRGFSEVGYRATLAV